MKKMLLMFLPMLAVMNHYIVDDEGGGGQADENELIGEEETSEQTDEEEKAQEKSDFESLPDWAQKQIKDLRQENGDRRTKSTALEDRLGKIEGGLKSMFGGGEGEELTPEQQLEAVVSENEALKYDMAMNDVCREHEISPDKKEYFDFLLNKACDTLEEGQELPEEALLEIVQQAKSSGAKANSSVEEDNGGKKPEGSKGEKTLEEFNKMSIVEKTKLYQESPAVYKSLFAQSRGSRSQR
ncbi:MAG: hypothetical protein KAG18_03150 [Sinobacterium sp.]|nr:hypothetical protein [Sinobacterium sp.]